ncbi:MAG: hypothetical protein K8I30_01895, partial [Anaerolineae bacterium]|nr:hypothetical protein [Anaerolineae bacterium]
FIAIALISPYFERKFVSWPLIPGGILALVGVLLFIGGGALNLLEWLGKLWPLALIAVGAYVLFAPRRKTQ